MRGGTRYLSMVAAFSLTVHTVLWAALAPHAASPVVDPFTIICHSETSGTADETSTPGPLAPTHACDHCNLCSAATPPLPPDTARLVCFKPVLILRGLNPAETARHGDVATDPKLARGPPAVA